jgi:hypothetical protein
MAILFSTQSSLTETYLRRCFQPSVVDQSNTPARFVVLMLNTSWTLHAFLFQTALAVESSFKIIFSLLSLNKTALYTNGLRLAAAPVNLLLITTSISSIALSILAPETALRFHQTLIGYTQLLPSYFDLKLFEQAELTCSGQNHKEAVFTNVSSAQSFLSLIQSYPRPEDLYLLTRSINHYWQPLPNLLTMSERLDEDSYHRIKVKASHYLSDTRHLLKA